jgi:hypothetical protein
VPFKTSYAKKKSKGDIILAGTVYDIENTERNIEIFLCNKWCII